MYFTVKSRSFLILTGSNQPSPFFFVSGVTDSAGTWTQQLAVSTSDGTHGYLRVEAVLSYGGVERRYYGRVALRAVPRRVGHK